jgi:hypothetical protein
VSPLETEHFRGYAPPASRSDPALAEDDTAVHTIDVIVVCAAVIVVVGCGLVLARQRFMLHADGSIPMALRTRGTRWHYGVARYADAELHWYRALGLGTRPSKVWQRNELVVVSRRSPEGSELQSLPSAAVIVQCHDGDSDPTLALGEGAFTGLVSWLEASAPI